MFSLRFMPRGVSPQQCRLRSALVTEQQLEALLASPEIKRMKLEKEKVAYRRKLFSYFTTFSVLALLALCWAAGGLVFISAAKGGSSQEPGLAFHAPLKQNGRQLVSGDRSPVDYYSNGVAGGPDSEAADRASVQHSEDDVDVDLPDKFAPLVEDGFEASLIGPTHHATLTATLEDVGLYANARGGFAVDDASQYIDGADVFEGTSFEGIPHVRPSSHEPVPGEEESLLQAATATDSGETRDRNADPEVLSSTDLPGDWTEVISEPAVSHLVAQPTSPFLSTNSNISVLLSESSNVLAGLVPPQRSSHAAGWLVVAAISAFFTFFVLLMTRAALAPTLHWMSALLLRLGRPFLPRQVLPVAAVTDQDCIKQHHAGTLAIEARDANSHAGTQLVRPQHSHALRGGFTPQWTWHQGRILISIKISHLAFEIRLPAEANSQQAVQTLMTALADAILPHLLTPGGRWGSTRAITQAPSTAGSLVVHMGPPHIIFFGVNLESRVEIRIAGLSGGSPVALTAPPVRTPSGQLVVRNRLRVISTQKHTSSTSMSRVSVSRQELLDMCCLLRSQLHGIRQKWFAALVCVDEQKRQLWHARQPKEDMLQIQAHLDAANAMCSQLAAERTGKQQLVRDLTELIGQRDESIASLRDTTRRREAHFHQELQCLRDQCDSSNGQLKAALHHRTALQARCVALEEHATQSDMKAAKADKMRQEKVAAAQREALKATATAERKLAVQRACAHEHEEKAKVATKRAAEEERRFHKRQAELEGRAACREAELESHMTKLQSERAQVAEEQGQLAEAKTEHQAARKLWQEEVAEAKRVLAADAAQNKEESAELGRRKKTVQASEQELLAKQETAKEEEVAAKAFEKELVSKFKRLDAELCKRDDKLAKHARKSKEEDARLERIKEELEGRDKALAAQIGEWNKAMDEQDQVILRERSIMRSTQDYIATLRADHELELLNQSIAHQRQLHGAAHVPSTDGLLNRLTQLGMPAQEAVGWASACQAERAAVQALQAEAVQSMQQRQRDMDAQMEAVNSRASSADSARAQELQARQSAEQRAQHAESQLAEATKQSSAAMAAVTKSLEVKDQAYKAAAADAQAHMLKALAAGTSARDAEQARLLLVSGAGQHSLDAKHANERADGFEKQAKHAQHAAQQAQHDAEEKVKRVEELEKLLEQTTGKQTTDSSALQLAQQQIASLKEQAVGLSKSVAEAREATRDAEQRELQHVAKEVTHRQSAESQQTTVQQNLDIALRQLDGVRQQRFDMEQLLDKARSEKQVSDAQQAAGQEALVSAKEALATGTSAAEAASHSATQELSRRQEVEQQLADVQQKLREECSKQQSRCQDLQVQGLALQAASDKAAAAQAAIASAERQALEASTAAAWEVKKRQELVQAHDAKLFAMQQELLKERKGVRDMEQELANQQALVQAQRAELARKQEVIAAEEEHVNRKKRMLASDQTDLDRRRVKIRKAEAKLPTSVDVDFDDVLSQMNSGMGIQKASPEMEAEDEYNAGHLEDKFEMARMFEAQMDDELAGTCPTPSDQEIKHTRRTEYTD